MKKLGTLFALSFFLVLSQVYAADTYKVDPVHSTIGFSVQHLMVSQVTGQFDKYEGTIVFDKDALAASKIQASVEASSVDTHNEKRDGHLQSPDFLDVAKFPTITFVSKQITPDLIIGDFTLKNVNKEVSIPAKILGPVKTSSGTVIGITGSFKINRQDYNVKWNKTLDQGGVAVGDDVTININIEAQKVEAAK